MRFKFMGLGKGKKGYTIIELLIVAAIIGILLAIAIPNLIKARISANEANARKAMQTLRDAEGEFFEQDADNNGTRDFTNYIGDLTFAQDGSLRCPDNVTGVVTCTEQDALVDNSFVDATAGTDGDPAGSADCPNSKAGYCVSWTGDTGPPDISSADWLRTGSDPILDADFGWEASPTAAQKSGRRDYGVWGDGVIRCTVSTAGAGNQGTFETTRDSVGGSVASLACD